MAKPAEKIHDEATDAPQPKLPAKFSENVRWSDTKLADSVRNVFEVYIDDDTPEDLLVDPRYWAHIADKLTSRDLIFVQTRNGTKLYVIRCQFCDRLARQVQMAILHTYNLPEVKPQANIGLPPGWEVRWLDTDHGYGAFRHNAMLRDGFSSAKEAADYIHGHASLR